MVATVLFRIFYIVFKSRASAGTLLRIYLDAKTMSDSKKNKGNAILVNRPWRPIGLWDVEAPTFSIDSRFTDGGKVVSPTRRTPFIPHKDSWYSFLLRGWVDPRAIVQMDVLVKLKNSTSSGLEPATWKVYELKRGSTSCKLDCVIGAEIA
jgi:hypothetical protein